MADPDRDAIELTRRELLVTTAAGLVTACATTSPPRAVHPAPVLKEPMDITLTVNGEVHHAVRIDPRTTLLDLLRETLGLTGTKKGCDMGQCGACTVLADGVRINSCLALAAQYERREITTIEGLAGGGALHPLQQAFLEEDAFQCGYCTPGQIMSGVGFCHEPWGDTDDDVREGMSGNLCRCGAYPHILAAVKRVRGKV